MSINLCQVGQPFQMGIPGALVQELAEPGMRCSSTRGGMEGRIAILNSWFVKLLVCMAVELSRGHQKKIYWRVCSSTRSRMCFGGELWFDERTW